MTTEPDDAPIGAIDDLLAQAAEAPEQDAVREIVVPFDDEDNPGDLTEEKELIESQHSDIPEQPEAAGFQPNPAFTDDAYRDLRTRVEERFTKTYNSDTVHVTEEERRRYLRAALHGENLWFDIDFPALGTVIRVVPATPAWTDSVTIALQRWRKDGSLGEDVSSWIDNFQLLHIWLQIDRVDGEPTPWFQDRIERANGVAPGARELLDILSGDEPINAVRNLNPARRHLLLSAVRIAEIKTCICMDALSDGSFFSSAGTN